jgi:hypothetical protein
MNNTLKKISKNHLFIAKYKYILILSLNEASLVNLNQLRFIIKENKFAFIKTKRSQLLNLIKNNKDLFKNFCTGYLLLIGTHKMNDLLIFYNIIDKLIRNIRILCIVKNKELIFDKTINVLYKKEIKKKERNSLFQFSFFFSFLFFKYLICLFSLIILRINKLFLEIFFCNKSNFYI